MFILCHMTYFWCNWMTWQLVQFIILKFFIFYLKNKNKVQYYIFKQLQKQHTFIFLGESVDTLFDSSHFMFNLNSHYLKKKIKY